MRDGQWVVPSGLRFRLLVLPESETMTVARLKQLLDGVRAGGAMLGQPPKATPGLTGYPQADAELQRLVDELWGTGQPVPERRVGKGVVFSSQTPDQALASLGVAPDFSSNRPLAWNHRKVDGADVYFIANSSQSATQARATFRVAGKQPELWNPETGGIELPETISEKDGAITIPLRLEPSGSVFVVFRKPLVGASAKDVASSPGPAKITVLAARYGLLDDPQKTLDVKAKVQALVDTGNPVIQVSDMAKSNDPAYGSVKTLEVTYSSGGKSATVSGERFRVPNPRSRGAGGHRDGWTLGGRIRSQVGRPGQGGFRERWRIGANVPKRASDTTRATATYRKTFPFQPSPSKPTVKLDLGKVAVMARVKLNGRDLGILWKPPYRVDITSALKAGVNALEIQVVNLWPNRLIGDEQLPEDSERKTEGNPPSPSTLKSWPQWLLDGQPSPTGRLTFSSWRLWKKDEARSKRPASSGL